MSPNDEVASCCPCSGIRLVAASVVLSLLLVVFGSPELTSYANLAKTTTPLQQPSVDMKDYSSPREGLQRDTAANDTKMYKNTSMSDAFPRQSNKITLKNHVITRMASGVLTSNVSKVPVVVWPYLEVGAKNAAAKHFEENGIKESLYLGLSDDIWNLDPNVVWVGDIGYGYGPRVWCDEFHKLVAKAVSKRAKLGLTLQWPVFIVDWTDSGMNHRCTKAEAMLGSDFVRYSRRSIVTGRRWNKEKDWVDVGRLANQSDVHHIPFFVRTDIIETLAHLLKEQHNMTLASPVERVKRKVDVAHFWPLNSSKGVVAAGSNLRRKISGLIADMEKTLELNVFVGLAGSALRQGRKAVQADYIEAMLDAKIVVVTQRDMWEDHYRLFEALVSGAMVMTDRMLSLPRGLENGTSVVEFENAQDLRSKTVHYLSNVNERLEIARKGREVSMLQHRTWHRIEEVIFGKPMTGCSTRTLGSPPCLWVVHAND